MTLAVVLTATPSSTLASGEPLAQHLAGQLCQAGARDVTLTADPARLAEVAELAYATDQSLLLCGADLVAHTAVLRHLATNPVGATVALVLADPAMPGRAAVGEDRGQVVVAGPAAELAGAATGAFGGALRVAVADLPALAAAARTVPAPDGAAPAVDALFAALTRTGTTIFAHRVRLLVAQRASDQSAVAAAESAVAAVDSRTAELRLSVKEKDDFFTTYAVSTWSPLVTRLAARIGLSPTGVTAISVLFAVAAAVLFGVGGRPAQVTGAVLLYLGFVLDCVDGQLARYTRRFTPYGGWLDTMADRAKEYLVYAGLAVGIERAGLGNGWTLAIAAMVLQTARHMTDTWYGVLHDEAARRPKATAAAGGAGGPGGQAAGGLGDRLSRASTRVQADTGSLSYWLKRTIVFPIGERWALIALTVALFNPLVSVIAVLSWGGLAAAYTLVLRTLRARSMRVPVLATVDTPLHRDDGRLAGLLGAVVRRHVLAGRRRGLPGPLPCAVLAVAAAAALLGAAQAGLGGSGMRWLVAGALLVALLAGLPSAAPHTGPLDWLVPAALRAAEYLFVIAVDVGVGMPGPVTFGLLFVLALHHYNLTARLEKRERAPLLRSFGLGWEGRLILLAVAVLAGVAAIAAGVLAGYLFVVFLVSATAGWRIGPEARKTGSAGPATGSAGPLAVGAGAGARGSAGSGIGAGAGTATGAAGSRAASGDTLNSADTRIVRQRDPRRHETATAPETVEERNR